MRRTWTTLLALPLVFASCSDTPSADTKPATGTIEVTIGSGPKIDIQAHTQTRTELNEDGESIRWADNDRIMLWAVNSQAQQTIDRQVFKLWHYNAEYNTAKFTATVPEMPEDTYTYYAVSPAPSETDGLEVRYRIPAEQDGTFCGDFDILVAAPVEGPALRQGDNSETVNFEFEHKVHVLKIGIPSNNLGEDISKITLTFPVPVAGILTVNAADPAAAPQLTDGSNILTLNFDTPKKSGDTVYAVIAPVELTPEQTVTVTATGATRKSRPKTFAGKHFAEGHTTPIAFNIPTVGPTTLRISLPDAGKSTLGENITCFTLTAAEGVDLGEGSHVRTFPVAAAGDFDFVFDEYPAALAGQSVAVSYESENARLSGGSFDIPDVLLAGDTNNIATLRVPYLYQEDFSTSISAPFETNSNWKSSNFSDTSASSLSNLPSGWTGTCVGGMPGIGIRVASHCIHGLFTVYTRCPGRIDSCPIKTIIPGKTPKVIVSYTYGGDRFEGTGSGGKILVSAGYTTGNDNPIKSDQAIASIKIPETAIDIDGPQTNNSDYTLGSKHPISYEIEQCPHGVRLSWRVYNDRSSTGNGTYWLYLDNIKVSIANE